MSDLIIINELRRADLVRHEGDFERNWPAVSVMVDGHPLGAEHYEYLRSLKQCYRGSKGIACLSNWWEPKMDDLGLVKEREVSILFLGAFDEASKAVPTVSRLCAPGAFRYSIESEVHHLVPCTDKRRIVRLFA